MARRTPGETFTPPTQDSYETGDPTQLQYAPVDQKFIDSDPIASKLARERSMGDLNNYLHTLGKRLPTGAGENYSYNVNTGRIERWQPPWYKDPALIGAIALPAAALAIPALGGVGAAGAAGGGGAAATGTGAGTAAGVLPSTAIGTGMAAPIAGGAGLAGAETAGIGAAGAAGAAGATEAALPSTTIGSGMATLPSAAGTGWATPEAGGGLFSNVKKYLDIGSKGKDILGSTGEAIGKATTAAGQNRLDQEHLALQAHGQNITGQSAFEQQLMARAGLEDRQRIQAAKDAYRNSVAHNLTSSPYNPRPQVLSDQFKGDMSNVGNAASGRLALPQQYTAGSMSPLAPYTPLDIKNLQASTNTAPSTLEKVGQWAGPISSVLSKVLKFGGK